MKTIPGIGVKPVEAIIFIVFALVYVAFQLWWTLPTVNTGEVHPLTGAPEVVAIAKNPAVILPFLEGQNIQTSNNNVLLVVVVVASLVYTVVATVVVKATESPVATFLMRLGMALSLYSMAGQIAAIVMPGTNWALPTEGIPVMHTATLAVAVGITLAGIGANMVWVGEKREQFLAQSAKKR